MLTDQFLLQKYNSTDSLTFIINLQARIRKTDDLGWEQSNLSLYNKTVWNYTAIKSFCVASEL